MKLMKYYFVVFIFTLSACAASESTNNLRRLVTPHPDIIGLFNVVFEYDKVIEEYGPGLKAVRERVRVSSNSEEVWKEVIEEVIPIYLKDHDIIPGECRHGVAVTGSRKDEAGNGIASFRCSGVTVSD